MWQQRTTLGLSTRPNGYCSWFPNPQQPLPIASAPSIIRLAMHLSNVILALAAATFAVAAPAPIGNQHLPANAHVNGPVINTNAARLAAGLTPLPPTRRSPTERASKSFLCRAS